MLRVLIATRGVVALRLVRAFRELGMETVAAFCAPDVERPYVQEADYDVYLGGETVEETFLVPERILSAALDSGCDIVHPGTCFLAERGELVDRASRASVAVVAPDADVLDAVTDRFRLFAAARQLQVPIVPTSKGPLAEDADAGAVAATLGYPVVVKALRGGAVARADRAEDLGAAVADARARGARESGDDAVYLQRVVRGRVRRVGTVVVADRHGTAMALGHTDTSVADGPVWLEEIGDVVPAALAAKLTGWAEALVAAIGFWGVGTVRWLVTEDGGAYLVGFSARLTTGYRLVERVHGVDLVRTQFRMMAGEAIGWDPGDRDAGRHAVQARVLHVAADGSRPAGEVEALVLPPGVEIDADIAEGDAVEAGHDRLLLTLTASAPTRHAALVQLTAALQALRVDGVQTNLPRLRAVLDARSLWSRTHDVDLVRSLPG